MVRGLRAGQLADTQILSCSIKNLGYNLRVGQFCLLAKIFKRRNERRVRDRASRKGESPVL